MPIHEIVLFWIVIFTIFLHVLIILIVFKKKKHNIYLKGSFFKLQGFKSIIELVMLLQFLFSMRLRKYGFLNFILIDRNWFWIHLPKITTIFHYYMKQEIYLCHIVLAANRFTAIQFPLRYDHFWSMKNLIISMILVILLPLPYVLYLSIDPNIHMNYMTSSTGTIRLSYNNETTTITALMDGISCIFSGILCIFIYIFIIIAAIKIWNEQKFFHTANYNNSQNNETTKIHVKLSFISGILFTTLLLNSICQSLTFYSQYEENDYLTMKLNDISYPIVDCLYCSGPYILLLTTKDLRTEILKSTRKEVKLVSVFKITKSSIL
uniref:Serpentine receptor class gamma n=1 Tax=Strongyloides venezuelensis TaxID=75913 RepID=A0A0K0FAL0_STRVS